MSGNATYHFRNTLQWNGERIPLSKKYVATFKVWKNCLSVLFVYTKADIQNGDFRRNKVKIHFFVNYLI